MAIRFLAEDERYKVYSLEESVYLKVKARSSIHSEYEATDLFIGAHYGNPTSALILQTFIITAGCGIILYEIEKQKVTHLFAESTAILWTEALHQSDDDNFLEFRYVIEVEPVRLRVCKMHALTREVRVLE